MNLRQISMNGAGPMTAAFGANGIPMRIALGVILVVCGLFLGILSTTGDTVKIGIGLGLLGGTFLLAVPRLVIWLVLALGLSTGALVSLAGPQYARLPWAISLLSFCLWPLALFSLLQQRRMPPFVWLALVFVVLCVTASVLDWYSLQEFASGFKRYFQAYGLLFALAALPLTADDMRRWRVLLLTIALMQLPFALYEFLVLVPLRGGLASGSDALDVVAGTFGANLNGGSANAEMAAFLLIAAGFLGMRWRAGLLSTPAYLACTLVCLVPLGLGETKIVVLLLPMLAFVLLRREFFRAPMRYLPALLVFLAITVALAYIYVTVMMKSTFSTVLADTLRYNLEYIGYGHAYLNRSTVLSFWWERHNWHDPLVLLFGHGIGSSFWAPDNPIAGHIGRHFPYYSIDLTAIAALLWDVGVIGTLLFLSVIGTAWHAAGRVRRDSPDPGARADATAIQGGLAILLVYLFYSSSAVNLLPFQILIATMLGYLAWMYRTLPATSASPAGGARQHGRYGHRFDQHQ